MPVDERDEVSDGLDEGLWGAVPLLSEAWSGHLDVDPDEAVRSAVVCMEKRRND